MNPRRAAIRSMRRAARDAQKAYMPLELAVGLSVALGLGSGVRRPEFLQRHLEAAGGSSVWYWLLRAYGVNGAPRYLPELGTTPSARKSDRATTGPHIARLARTHRLRDLTPPALPKPRALPPDPDPALLSRQVAKWAAYRSNLKERADDAVVRSAELASQPSPGYFDRRRARRRARRLWLLQRNETA